MGQGISKQAVAQSVLNNNLELSPPLYLLKIQKLTKIGYINAGWETSTRPLINASENLARQVENRPGQVEFCIGYVRDCPVRVSAKKCWFPSLSMVPSYFSQLIANHLQIGCRQINHNVTQSSDR